MPQYNYSKKRVEEPVPETTHEDLTDGLKFQNEERIVWLDHSLQVHKVPKNTIIVLLGSHDIESRNITIDLVIDHNLTEYRVNLYKKVLLPIVKGEIDDLKHAHRNMVNHFIKQYSNIEFKTVLEKWLSWNTNPTYDYVLRKLIE